MSLRDQLLRAGVVSKKDAARVDRQKKAARKKQQGSRRRQTELEREQAAAAAAEQARIVEETRVRRKALERAREAEETVLRVQQLIRGNAVRVRGPQSFWVKRPDGRVCRLSVSPAVAFKLRCGELGVAAPTASDEPVVVARQAIDRLIDLDPASVWFYVADTEGISAHEEQFLVADWDVSLAPHRQKASTTEAQEARRGTGDGTSGPSRS